MFSTPPSPLTPLPRDSRDILPNRDPTHRNHIPISQFPFPSLPPFAIGPHYILSHDLVSFLATNTCVQHPSNPPQTLRVPVP